MSINDKLRSRYESLWDSSESDPIDFARHVIIFLSDGPSRNPWKGADTPEVTMNGVLHEIARLKQQLRAIGHREVADEFDAVERWYG